MHNVFENILDTEAAFRADEQRVGGGNRQHAFDLLFNEVGLRGRQVDFVDYGNDRQIIPGGEKGVGDGLRFDALARVHHEQGAFARRKRARHFIGKIHMARRVDQVELVGVAVFRGVMQADAFRFDGDAALALEIHGVEELLVHFALRKRAGHFQQAVRQRGLAVIDMRNDAKIADELRVHGARLPLWLRYCCDFYFDRQEPHASGSQTTRPRKTMPCNSSVCHKSLVSAAGGRKVNSRQFMVDSRESGEDCLTFARAMHEPPHWQRAPGFRDSRSRQVKFS